MGMLLARGGGRHIGSELPVVARVPRRTVLASGLASLAAALLPRRAAAALKDDADTSDRAREDAIRSLPLSELTAESRRKLMAVIERPSIYRRMPQQSIDCDPALYLFLIRNPEVLVNIWQVMGISTMSAERRGPYDWKGNDGAGTLCDVELIYGTDDMHIVYGDGFYEGSLLKRKITGRCVVLLKSAYAQTENRRWQIGNRLDIFLQIDNLAADVIARTFAPFVGKVADANFEESCKFASRLSLTAEQNGAGVQRLSDKLTNVEPPIREQFTRVAAAVQERAAARDVGLQARRR
jgi:hypothetical protein